MTPDELTRFRQIPVPDLWPEVEHRLDDRATRPPARRPQARRIAVVVSALAIAAAGVAVVTVSFLGTSRPKPETPLPSRFPGIGRILFTQSGTLGWLSPDGTVQRIAKGFIGARLFPGFPGDSGTLLAWKLTREDNDYYTMALDGSGVRHVLAPGPSVDNVPPGHEAVQVSPDGKKLAYLAYTSNQVAPGRARFELYVMDLQTRRTTDLGEVGPFTTCCHTVVWNDDSVALLVQSADARSVQNVGIQKGPKDSERGGTYLRVDDPRLVSAYARAWPGAGPPTEIAPIGWDPDPEQGDLAVLLSQSGGFRPAVAILTNRHTVAFAPNDGRPNVSIAWGLHGQFVLFSYSSPRSGGEYGSLYLGEASTGKLRRLATVNRGILDPLVEPLGAWTMFMESDGTWRFVSLRPPYREKVVQIKALPFDWGL